MTTSGQTQQELGESECLELLRGVDVGRIAVRLDDGGVDIFPMNFVVDQGTILIRTAAGTKLDSIKREPSVGFEADFYDYFERVAWSVVIKGDAKVVKSHDDLFALLNVDLDAWHPERKPFFVRIVPTSITGRRFAIRRRVQS